MKKLISMMFLAAAAMTFTACSDAEDIMPNESNNGKGLTIIADNPDVTNDTRTLMGYEGKNIVPMWGKDDCIYMYGPGSDQKARFDRAEAQPGISKTAMFRETNIGEFNKLFATCDKVYAIYSQCNNTSVSNNIVTIKSNVNNNFIGYDEDITKNNEILYRDILISEEMSPASVLINNAKPRFKRYTAVIRVNIKDETTDKVTGGTDYTYFNISNEKDYFLTDVKFNMLTGEITKDESAYYAEKDISPNMNDANIKNGKAFYMMSLPVSLKEGDKISFTVEALSGYTFVKNITLGAKGMNIQSGKITTFNISLRDADITQRPIVDPTPDAAVDPTYTPGSGLITMKDGHCGRLTGKMLAKAINTDAMIKVVGNINAFDLNSILKLVREPELTKLDCFIIDLSEADIIGGDGSKCTGFNNVQYEITESDIIPTNLFYGDVKTIERLILPNSLKTIKTEAIGLDYLQELVIGKGIQTIETEALYLYSGQVGVYILAGPETAAGIADRFIYEDNNDIYLNSSWKGHPAGPQAGNDVWKAITWNSIGYCDDNGNPVQ